MRAKRAPQRSFFDVGYPNHEMGRALERILPIPAMPTTDSAKPTADSGPCRSRWRSGGP